jgi:hypothetical protein
VLTGSEARRFVARLEAERPEYVAARERSAGRLRERGYTPLAAEGGKDDGVFVIGVPGEPRKAGHLLAQVWGLVETRVSAQDYFQTWRGYMVAWPWEDGDPATWSGNMYFVDQWSGIQMSIDNTFVMGDPDHPIYWAYGELHGSRGPMPVGLEDVREIIGGGVRLASMGGESAAAQACGCSSGGRLARCLLAEGWRQAKYACAGAVIGALFCGPHGYLACLGGGCTAAFVGYTLQAAAEFYDACVR